MIITKWSVTRNLTQMKVLWYLLQVEKCHVKVKTSLTECFPTLLKCPLYRWHHSKVKLTFLALVFVFKQLSENLQLLWNSPYSIFCDICRICSFIIRIIATMLLLPNHNRIFQACIYRGYSDHTCIGIKGISLGKCSCNIGTCDLPDMYACSPRIHIRQITHAHVTTIK